MEPAVEEVRPVGAVGLEVVQVARGKHLALLRSIRDHT